MSCCHSMFGGAGKVNTDEDLDVSQTEYDKGYTLYGFNLATDHNQDQVFEVSKRGMYAYIGNSTWHSHTPSTYSCTQSMRT